MNRQNDAQPTAKAFTGAPTRAGAIRRFFNAWQRWENLMDYSPYDYTLDRIGRLELRVLELERERNAAGRLLNAPDRLTQIGTKTDTTFGEHSNGKLSV